tara:strand:+ start:6320 stop:7240 length:921 start_codon:yes stop_codon:yes gene_type:complete
MWIKKGLVFQPNKNLSWQHSHAALPTVLFLSDNIIRVYFTSRDKSQKTYVGFFDAEITEDGISKICHRSVIPIVSHGDMGYFDSQGVQCTSVVRHNKEIYMYYLGWNIGIPSPIFYTSIGLAISKDGGKTFNKYSKAPIMERSRFDPWMVSGGTILIDKGIWKMWYISGISINVISGKAYSKYDIKYAESKDGINWIRNGIVAFPLGENESNISRVSIIFEDSIYKAWFPVHKKNEFGYCMGYAESEDGINWQRNDSKYTIEYSKNGWDSKSIDKMQVFSFRKKKIMLYNGNNFGLEGIGCAIYSQ